jgi:hypothetical protein
MFLQMDAGALRLAVALALGAQLGRMPYTA